MIINISNNEFLIETKIYYNPSRFVEGKNQLAHYCESLKLKKGDCIVFYPKHIKYPETVKEDTELINNIEISTYLIEYDETKW